MSDIVERLWLLHDELMGDGWSGFYLKTPKEAADTIEALRKENEKLRGQLLTLETRGAAHSFLDAMADNHQRSE